MKKQLKLFLTAISLCLVVALGVIGIFAVKTLNMSVGGNITFSAEGLNFSVSKGEFKTESDAPYTNISTDTSILQAFAMDTNTKQSDIQDELDSWSSLDLRLSSLGDAYLYFTVTNNMQDVNLAVDITIVTLGTNDNENMNIIVNSDEVVYGTPKQFVIIFDILDESINAGLTGFDIDVDFSSVKKVVLPAGMGASYKIDTETGKTTKEIDYYFIEMGTYEGNPIKWRLVSTDLTGPLSVENVPTSLGGYYILDTEIPVPYAFHSTTSNHSNGVYPSDYALSDIRVKINDTSSNGIMHSLGISTTNDIYKQIKLQSMEDLYKGIGYHYTPGDIPSQFANQFSNASNYANFSQKTDRFFLPSIKELIDLEIPQSWCYGTYSNLNGSWTRTPDTSGSLGSVRKSRDGSSYLGDNPSNAYAAVRLAFII